MRIIAAVDERWGIGKNGGLLFSLPSDMSFFKEKTMGETVIMGRKTFESLPGGKPLCGRENIVLSADKGFTARGVRVFHAAEDLLREYADSGAFVIGGGRVYELLLPYCSEAYITRICADGGADVFFPNLDASKEWRAAEISEPFTENGVELFFCKYERIKPNFERTSSGC
ncbi:MAG: dihydrofolate reductase [Firmicutes bacterium]|nr:dihydrofolate reductase [Bacillota bacterium]